MIELLLEAERALSFGRVDRAEQLYRQVAAADPGNSIAVVGLARVALEHADDAGAYLLARQALTIDPENEAAQRLVTRLDEVMRTRGETVPEPPSVPPAVHAQARARRPLPRGTRHLKRSRAARSSIDSGAVEALLLLGIRREDVQRIRAGTDEVALEARERGLWDRQHVAIGDDDGAGRIEDVLVSGGSSGEAGGPERLEVVPVSASAVTWSAAVASTWNVTPR